MNEVQKLLELKAGQNGDRVYWTGERAGLKVMAKDNRHIVCVRNRFGTPNYSVLDTQKGLCGTLIQLWVGTHRINLFNVDDCELLISALKEDETRLREWRSAPIKGNIDFERTFKKAGIEYDNE